MQPSQRRLDKKRFTSHLNLIKIFHQPMSQVTALKKIYPLMIRHLRDSRTSQSKKPKLSQQPQRKPKRAHFKKWKLKRKRKLKKMRSSITYPITILVMV